MWEHVKLALGLLVHWSSPAYFKGRKKLKQLTAVGAEFSTVSCRDASLWKSTTDLINFNNQINVESEQRHRLVVVVSFVFLCCNWCWISWDWVNISGKLSPLTSSHSAVNDGVLSSLPSGLAPSRGLGLPGPWPRDPDPQLCSSCKKHSNKTFCL